MNLIIEGKPILSFFFKLRSEAINFYAVTSDQPDRKLSNFALLFRSPIIDFKY